jgi:hypothetical protein
MVGCTQQSALTAEEGPAAAALLPHPHPLGGDVIPLAIGLDVRQHRLVDGGVGWVEENFLLPDVVAQHQAVEGPAAHVAQVRRPGHVLSCTSGWHITSGRHGAALLLICR